MDINTESYFCIAMDPKVTLSDSSGWDLNIVVCSFTAFLKKLASSPSQLSFCSSLVDSVFGHHQT